MNQIPSNSKELSYSKINSSYGRDARLTRKLMADTIHNSHDNAMTETKASRGAQNTKRKLLGRGALALTVAAASAGLYEGSKNTQASTISEAVHSLKAPEVLDGNLTLKSGVVIRGTLETVEEIDTNQEGGNQVMTVPQGTEVTITDPVIISKKDTETGKSTVWYAFKTPSNSPAGEQWAAVNGNDLSRTPEQYSLTLNVDEPNFSLDNPGGQDLLPASWSSGNLTVEVQKHHTSSAVTADVSAEVGRSIEFSSE